MTLSPEPIFIAPFPMPENSESESHPSVASTEIGTDSVCPVCSAKLISEKCKVVCRSECCRYRIVFNCAEF